MLILHLVAHAIPGTYPLASADACWRLWRALRRSLPKVLAAYLMPNHIHLIAVARSRDALRRRVAQVLAGFSRSTGGGPVWLRLPAPVVIGDPAKLSRQIRYSLLNGTRANVYSDPACAIWSTYRDIIGATLDPWVDVADLAALLGHDVEGFDEWFHHYVSSDPSVDVAGTPLPRPAPRPSPLQPGMPLDHIAAAASAVSATALGTDRRRARIEQHAFVLAARHQGWNDANTLAGYRGLSASTVRRLARTPDPQLLRATTLYLGDERLLTPPRFRRAA